MIALPKSKAAVDVAALIITSRESDFECLFRIFYGHGWTLQLARSVREACTALDKYDFPVIVCESELPDGTWRRVRGHLGGTPAQFIVCSRLAEERLWVEVLEAGGYDVIATPFRDDDAARVIRGAYLEWLIDRAASAAGIAQHRAHNA